MQELPFPESSDQREPRDHAWRALMRAAQAGDRVAYEQLLRQLMSFVRMRARHLCRNSADLEELVQDILLSVHRVRHTYDPGRPFTPWLAAIVERRSIDGWRRRRRLARLEARDAPIEAIEANVDEPPNSDESLDDAIESARRAARLTSLLARLPPRQRQALEMVKLREMSLAEASLTTGQTVGALKVNAHRGLKRLRDLLMNTPPAAREED